MKNYRILWAVLMAAGGLLFSTAVPLGAASPFFTNGTLSIGRAYHTATLLPTGKILVAGGYNGNSIATSELYDPATGTSATNGTMITARHYHTATLLGNGKVLVAGGLESVTGGGGSTQTILINAELYDPVGNTWTATGSLNTARLSAAATLLPGGKVLVAGGESPVSTAINSAEIYDPATGNWTTISNMTLARYGHTMTLLPDGTVLAAGGRFGIPQAGGITATAEIFDPVAGSWTSTGSMSTNRYEHTATLLNNGHVMVAGGASAGAAQLASAEIYDPVAKTWSTTGSMNVARQLQTATLLPSGKVMVISGDFGSAALVPTNSVEVYDPVAGTWSTNGPVNTARANHTATQLPGGQVVLIGGVNGTNYFASIETFEPTNGNWTTVGPLNFGRYEYTMTLLTNGLVLAAGGNGAATTNCELFNPATTNWTSTGSMNSVHYSHTMTQLQSGKVLVAGGYNGSITLTNSEVYDPGLGTWALTGGLNGARIFHTATLLPSGKVLAAGGYNGANFLSSAEIYDPGSGVWTLANAMNAPREFLTATLLLNGKVLVTGGFSTADVILNSTETYDPSTGLWTTNSPMNVARMEHLATLLRGGKVLVTGGFNDSSDWLASCELFDPTTGKWTLTGSMTFPREEHTATLLPDGRVMVATGFYQSTALKVAEVYDPATGVWLPTNSLSVGRYEAAAELLPNGKVLVAGGLTIPGNDTDSEVFDTGLGYSNAVQPLVTNVISSPALGTSIVLGGALFRGVSEGSGGNGAQDSPADFPLVQVHSVESGQSMFLAVTNWTTNSLMTVPLTNFPFGCALVTVFVDGIPSQSLVANVVKGTAIVTLSNLIQTNDGTAKSVTVTTVPSGLTVNVTYNGSSAAPTNVGSYTVIALVNDPDLQGGATNTLQIVAPPARNLGVDVSHFQDSSGIPETNYAQMVTQGNRFAYVKSTEGLTGANDPTMAVNVSNALQAGLLVGVYHFAHPENRPTTNGAVMEADNFLNYSGSAIGPGMLRPVLDMEETSTNLPPTAMTDWALAFMQEVVNNRGTGAEPIIYCLTGFAQTQFDSRLASNLVWISTGSGNPTNGSPGSTGVFTNWAFWQYNYSGSAGGISPIDLDVCHDEFAPLSSYLIPAAAGGFRLQSATLDGTGFHVSFTNVPGTHFTLVASTNVSTALSNWTAVAGSTEVSPGQFQLLDSGATNLSRRFYRVKSP